MTKHSPGPWGTADRSETDSQVVDADGFEIANAEHVAVLSDYGKKLGIRHWGSDPRACRRLSKEEVEANARLMAAAPDLLEACKHVLGFVKAAIEDRVRLPDFDWREHVDAKELIAAITKAEPTPAPGTEGAEAA